MKWPINWLTNLIHKWLTDQLTDWLTHYDWLTYAQNDWLPVTDWMNDYFTLSHTSLIDGLIVKETI